MKTFITAIIFAMLSASAVASGAANAPVPALVKSWGKAVNMTLVWEAGTQYDGRIVALEKDGNVSSLESLQSALTELNKRLGVRVVSAKRRNLAWHRTSL